MKQKHKQRAGKVEMYEYYCTKVQNPLPYTSFKEILDSFYTTIVEDTIYTGNVYKLPFKLGVFGILKTQRKKNTSIDYETLQKEGIWKRYTRKHSEGLTSNFKWLKSMTYGGDLLFPTIWRFKASLKNNKKLAEAILNHNVITKHYFKNE